MPSNPRQIEAKNIFEVMNLKLTRSAGVNDFTIHLNLNGSRFPVHFLKTVITSIFKRRMDLDFIKCNSRISYFILSVQDQYLAFSCLIFFKTQKTISKLNLRPIAHSCPICVYLSENGFSRETKILAVKYCNQVTREC